MKRYLGSKNKKVGLHVVNMLILTDECISRESLLSQSVYISLTSLLVGDSTHNTGPVEFKKLGNDGFYH